MRLLHTSDWHLGRTLFQAGLLEHQREFLDWLLATALEQHVDAVLVSGDVFDRAYPPVEAVALLDDALAAFAEADVPVIIVSGNHDSAVRLGFGGRLSRAAGIHLRTTVAEIDRPVVLHDEHGPVAVYGIPYLLPDAAVLEGLEAERSHESVLAAATARILADADERGITRTVALSHSFVTGSTASVESESERDVRVGGIGDAPAHVFDGLGYVALGHLHRPQDVRLSRSETRVRYSGSPLAFSFSEKDDVKSVTLVELDADGVASVDEIPVPVPRPLREVRGTLDDLLAEATTTYADLAGCWVKATLTDQRRPSAPMERLRAHWPHTLVLDFAPEGGLVDAATDLARLRRTTDPVEVCSLFVEYVDGEAPGDDEVVELREAVETAQRAEAHA
jgi:exonuclease SbcD